VMSPIIGKLADMYSIQTVLAWLPVVPLLTMLLCLRLPEKKQAS